MTYGSARAALQHSKMMDDLSGGSVSTGASRTRLHKIASLEVGPSGGASTVGDEGGLWDLLHPPSCEEQSQQHDKKGNQAVFMYIERDDRNDNNNNGGHHDKDGASGRYSDNGSTHTASTGVGSRSAYSMGSEAGTYHSNRQGTSVASTQDDSEQHSDSIAYAPVRHNQYRNKNVPLVSPYFRGHLTVPTTALSSQKKNTSILGSLFQCTNPVLPVDVETQITSYNTTTGNELQKAPLEEDALDRVFNVVEQVACRDDANALQGDFKSLQQQQQSQPKRDPAPSTKAPIPEVKPQLSFKDRFLRRKDPSSFQGGDSTKSTCSSSGGSSVSQNSRYKWNSPNKNKLARKTEKDALDTVFEGVEKMTCGTDLHQVSPGLISQERDGLDRIFENVERLSCYDDVTTAANIQKSSWKTISHRNDPPAYKAKGKYFLKDGDIFDHLGRGFEHLVCNGKIGAVGREGDMLDKLFEHVEATTCQHPGKRIAPMDLSNHSRYDIDWKNSLVERTPTNESRSAFRNALRQYSGDRRRQPSPANSQLTQDTASHYDKDMLDFVFESVESGVCSHTSDSRVSGRERARSSLQRLKSLRRQFEDDVGYS